jgi:hypothetical protein
MEYSRIVAVTGLPGLFEVVASKADGAIVRSLDDKTTRFLSSRVHSLSHLESIEIYTVDENVNLVDVFQAMKENKSALPDAKDNTAVRKYFEKVYPNMDFERVYASDMKKMVKWFEVLNNNNIDIKLSEPEEEDAEETVDTKKEETVTTLEVGGLDTAETAKPKTKKKAAEEEVEEKPKKSASKAASKSAPAKAAPAKSAPAKSAKSKAAPSKEAKSKDAKKKKD